MKLIERFIQSKTGQSSTCEDYIYANEYFAAVIDGVSSKTKSMHSNKTTGQLAAELIIKAIEKLDKESTAENAVTQITQTIKQYYIENNLYDIVKNNPVERAAACVAIYSSFQKQVWIVGDCQCRLNGEVYTNEFKMDDTASEVRSLFLKMERMKGKTVEELLKNDTGREYIAPLLNNQALFENLFEKKGHEFGEQEYSYGVINGFEVPSSRLKIVKVGNDSEFVVLASDGYPILKDTLKESEEQLKFVMEKDPLCMDIYKSTKGIQAGNVSFDDRAYLKIEIE